MALRLQRPFSLQGLEQTTLKLHRSFAQLASGRRITRAAVDAAGLALSERFAALSRSMAQGARNLNDGISAAGVADGGLSAIGDHVVRLRELSIAARNGTLGDGERAIIQQEFDSIVDEIDRVAGTTRFVDRSLLDGSASGSDAIRVEDGSGDPVEISIDDHSAASLGLAGLAADDPNALAAIDQAQQTVSETRAGVGAAENRIESQIRSIQVQIEQTEAARSRIADADVAETVSRKTANAILQRFHVAASVHANAAASVALQLL